MTIINPSKGKIKIHLLVVLIIIFLAAGLYIYEYNRLVSLRYQVLSLEEAFSEYGASNSSLKKQLSQLIDSSREVKNLAQVYGLILNENPEYLIIQ